MADIIVRYETDSYNFTDIVRPNYPNNLGLQFYSNILQNPEYCIVNRDLPETNIKPSDVTNQLKSSNHITFVFPFIVTVVIVLLSSCVIFSAISGLFSASATLAHSSLSIKMACFVVSIATVMISALAKANALSNSTRE